jgi:hypothetical protein
MSLLVSLYDFQENVSRENKGCVPHETPYMLLVKL